MPAIAIDQGHLWVEEAGAGTPIVFSHSLFFDLRMFHNQVAAFRGSHRVVTYDHRGQGRSSAGTPATLDVDRLTEDAAALIASLEAGPCHFVGNSLGGFVAMRLAARHPDLLLSCTVLGSSGEAEHRAAEFAPLVEALRAQGAEPHIAAIMHIMFGDTFLADPARVGERMEWERRIAALPPSIADAAHAVVFRSSILEELKGCKVPVLAIAGAEDHAYGPTEARNIASASGGRHETIPRAGHSLALEKPLPVNELLAGVFAHAAQARAA